MKREVIKALTAKGRNTKQEDYNATLIAQVSREFRVGGGRCERKKGCSQKKNSPSLFLCNYPVLACIKVSKVHDEEESPSPSPRRRSAVVSSVGKGGGAGRNPTPIKGVTVCVRERLSPDYTIIWERVKVQPRLPRLKYAGWGGGGGGGGRGRGRRRRCCCWRCCCCATSASAPPSKSSPRRPCRCRWNPTTYRRHRG